MEEWTEAIDNNLQVDTVYLYFWKAFDIVPHKRLLQKLDGYGIKGVLLKWLENVLTKRQQRVVINGNVSNWTEVLSGIPQGSILGPILFIFYINDLLGVVESVCKLFADDCKLCSSIASEGGQKELQEDIERLCKWSKDRLLDFNIGKCKVVSYGKVEFEWEYEMSDNQNNTHILETVDSESDLEIMFNRNLKFDEHIDSTVNKVNRIIGLIKRKFTHMDKDLSLTLYKSLVRLKIDYGNIVFYPTTKNNIQVLENAQRRASRLIPELRITKTCLYNFDPLKPHFYIVKLGFTGVYIIFLISAQKHRLWVLVRTASPRRY